MDETSEEPGTSSSNKEKTKVESSSNMTLCPVCQESAICHRHYGGFSCLSCKAFFRRAVTSKVGSKEKTCRFRKAGGDELCGVKRCAACRMVKCRETGMKAQFVLSGKKEALKHVGRVNKVRSMNIVDTVLWSWFVYFLGHFNSCSSICNPFLVLGQFEDGHDSESDITFIFLSKVSYHF